MPDSQRTVGEAIRNRAELQPEHTAVVSPGFTPLSYRDLQRLIDDVRAALRANGFDRSARIAIGLPNGPHAALAIVAVACSAVSIPFNPRQTVREIETSIATLQPVAIILLKDSDSAARKAANSKGLDIIELTPSAEGTLAFRIAMPGNSTTATPAEPDEPDPDAPAFILQTSGTAAEPKLIPFSHRNMLAAAGRVQGWFNLTSQDRCLAASPVFYSHGLKVTVFTPLLTGGTVAFPSDTTKFDFLEWFSFLKPTWYSAGPTLHRLVFDQTQGRADAKTGHALRFILSGGAPLPENVLEGLQKTLGVPVVEHYGSSEAAQISANLPPPGASKPGTCGIPPAGTIVIVDDDGQPLTAGQQGEILVGGPTVISGYLGASELNRTSFDNGWFKSGDVGSIDHDGFLTLHGRKSDVINRGGEKISPAEIDDALLAHPAVAEVAAFPVPHARLGEDVAAAVVLRPGMTATSVELRRFLQDKVASFKVPRRIVIRDQLPKGITGKVQRRRLAESWDDTPAASGQTQAIASTDNTTTQDTLVKGLLAVWERLLKTSPLTIDDDFFEKGGDSLLATDMLFEVEALTGQTIPSSILFEATTIRQLAEVLSQSGGLQQKYLSKMNASGQRRPLIYFHGHFNAFGRHAITLANILGPDQPLFVVAPHGTGKELIPDSIEAMAADRLPLILEAQPDGPYRLGGQCLGGIIAFEVARMLVDAGKEVEMVVMVDPPTINARKTVQSLFSTMRSTRPIFGATVDQAMAWTWFRGVQLQRFLNYSWNKRAAAIWRRLDLLAAKVRGGAAPIVRDDSDVNEQMLPIGRFADTRTSRYAAAMSHYVPQPLALRVIYIKVDFGTGAWRKISPDLEVAQSQGTHEFIDFANVAEHLKTYLKPAE